MIIRKYAQFPALYAPDIGEVILARRAPVDQFTRAVVLFARRNKNGHLKVKVQWLDDYPEAGASGPKPIKANTIGWVIADPDKPPLIKQISRGSSS